MLGESDQCNFSYYFGKGYINFVGTKCWKFINDTVVGLAPQPRTCSFISNYLVQLWVLQNTARHLTAPVQKLLVSLNKPI